MAEQNTNLVHGGTNVLVEKEVVKDPVTEQQPSKTFKRKYFKTRREPIKFEVDCVDGNWMASYIEIINDSVVVKGEEDSSDESEELSDEETNQHVPSASGNISTNDLRYIECEWCDQRFRLHHVLNFHIKQKHPEIFNVVNANEIDGHQTRQNGAENQTANTPLRLKLLKSNGVWSSSFTSGFVNDCNRVKKEFVCQICNESFDRRRHLKRHSVRCGESALMEWTQSALGCDEETLQTTSSDAVKAEDDIGDECNDESVATELEAASGPSAYTVYDETLLQSTGDAVKKEDDEYDDESVANELEAASGPSAYDEILLQSTVDVVKTEDDDIGDEFDENVIIESVVELTAASGPSAGACTVYDVIKTEDDDDDDLSDMEWYNIENAKNPVDCSTCWDKFFTNDHLYVHQTCHLIARPYTCRHCIRTFAHVGTRKNHEKVHNPNRKVVVRKTAGKASRGGKTRDKTQTPSTAATVVRDKKVCPVCDKRYVYLGALTKHVYKVHFDDSGSVGDNANAEDFSVARRVKRRANANAERGCTSNDTNIIRYDKVKCEHCGKLFNVLALLMLHLSGNKLCHKYYKSHHRAFLLKAMKNVECWLCKITFSPFKKFKEHVTNVHKLLQ